ncbi:MAG TPA: hypothetical protein VF266_11295 [Thermoanaerobaculia bacterium]
MPREPQSYGSGSDWVTGKTDQQVNDQKSEPAPEHREFYDDRRESETSSSAQGGHTSDVQLAESAQPAGQTTGTDESPQSGVTTTETGAKRGSFFRKRDYE